MPGMLDNPFVPTVTATTLDGAVGQIKAQLIATGVMPELRRRERGHDRGRGVPDGDRRPPIGAASGDGRIRLVAGQESDDLVRNRVTVLVEGRWTPLVSVPSAFALHDLSA
ncbi:MAG TPA: hypothetical protein VHI71_06490 [Actinomycetota bacterium]|nr:hypothetical protein [Actinomycetota bacterium]